MKPDPDYTGTLLALLIVPPVVMSIIVGALWLRELVRDAWHLVTTRYTLTGSDWEEEGER